MFAVKLDLLRNHAFSTCAFDLIGQHTLGDWMYLYNLWVVPCCNEREHIVPFFSICFFFCMGICLLECSFLSYWQLIFRILWNKFGNYLYYVAVCTHRIFWIKQTQGMKSFFFCDGANNYTHYGQKWLGHTTSFLNSGVLIRPIATGV